jgi:membrane protein required for colicin V production
MNVSVIDIVFLLLIILFIIRCYLKGFVGEVFSMAAIILGILSSLFFYKNGGEYLRNTFWPGLKVIPEIIAFIALFIIVFIAIKILELIFKGIIERVKLSGMDRFLGSIFGLAEGIAVVSLVLFILKIQPLFNPSSILSDSVFANFLLPLITGSQDVPDV